MSRTDLVLKLAKAGYEGNRPLLQRTLEALAEDARAKQQHTLAKRYASAITATAPSVASASPLTFLPEKVRDLLIERPAVRRFDDLVLSPSILRSVRELVEEHTHLDLLRSHGMEPKNSLLLLGAPGTGKTTLAEIISSELGLPFYTVRYEALVGSYLGETAGRLREVFDYCSSTPCVLFFDEFEAVGKERADTQESGEMRRIVSSLLIQLDALPSTTVVVCASNHPEMLDRAVWRRFDLVLELPLPTRDQVRDLLKKVLHQYASNSSFNADELSLHLEGASFSEIEKLLVDVRRRGILATVGDCDSSIDDIIERWLNRMRRMSGEDWNERSAGTKASGKVRPKRPGAKKTDGKL
ncbi:hypothetical protein NS226_01560 [Aureimonas ureilytica]|uniref:AAA+ ATPase domain-containing protein n=1 Tax=Aureimonas ureilytica TaxID=401562 RepID=A0A175RFV2_9HYPH|nr:ATP-binding protein [Aureimonas ureilytica]KTQ98255.1 hypothetical protein NS226_01560 [Aureimonas ureilytica]